MTRKVALVVAMTVAVCAGQVRGGGRAGGGRGGYPAPPRPYTAPVGQGFGNVVFPGTGIPNPPTYAQRLSATISGNPFPRGVAERGGHRGYGYGGGVIPYAVPVFVGGYGYGYDPGYAASQPNITIVNAPPQQPSVIINNGYQPDQAKPVMRDYSNDTLPPPAALESYQAPVPNNPEGRRGQMRSVDAEKPTVYLVAFKDGVVYSSLAYWVEGDTLHYITTKYAHNRASMDLVDLALSRQLNSERGVEFEIPARK